MTDETRIPELSRLDIAQRFVYLVICLVDVANGKRTVEECNLASFLMDEERVARLIYLLTEEPLLTSGWSRYAHH